MTELSWLIGALIALAAGLWLVIGMRLENRNLGKTVQTADRERLNARAYKEQLNLLELRRDSNEINAQQFDDARSQLEQTLLGELDAPDAGWQNRPWPLAAKLTLTGLVVATALFGFVLSNGQQHFAVGQVASSAGQHSEQDQASVEEMVDSLAKKLEQEPENLQGWVMLGRSYSVMRRYDAAAKAYHQANKLTGSSEPELLVAEAEALGLAAGQNLTGEPLALIHKALALDKNNVRGLWYGLLAATQTGDEAQQQDYLQRLEARPDLPEQLAQLLRSEFSADLAMDKAPTSAASQAEAASGPVLNLLIDVSAALKAQLPDNATLFVFAKAQQGPPMPLAVSRQPLPNQWPIKVRLDDSMGMMENMRLSSFPAWTVVARISTSGMAQAQSGDWQVSQDVDKPSNSPLTLTISEQLP